MGPWSHEDLSVLRTHVTLHVAGLQGGAILFNKSAPACADNASCTLNISSSTFTQNAANMSGGGVSIFTDNLHVALNSSNFTGNSAQQSCGGLCLQTAASSGSLSMTSINTTFTANSAAQSAGMSTNASSVHLTNCTFSDNTASSGNAGGLNAHYVHILLLDGCTFENNSAGVHQDKAVCVLLCCAALRCAALCCAGLCCAALRCAVLGRAYAVLC